MSVVSRQTDAELLDAARAGNVSAFGALYERHGGAARTLARQIIHDDAEAEDVVAETFTKILDVIRWGGGPESAFRPYLLTAVRRTVHDRAAMPPVEPTPEELMLRDPGVTFVDPALTGLEDSAIARAFLSLPEQWRMVLWHAEVESAKAADVAPLLGVSHHGVATLAYRAREGLREAYLRIRLADEPAESCRPIIEKMSAHVRGGLSKTNTRLVDAHVDDCSPCRTIFLELLDITQGLRVIVGPLFAGPFLAAYLAGLGMADTQGTGTPRRFRHLPRSGLAVGIALGTAVVVGGTAFVLVSANDGMRAPRPGTGRVPAPLTPTMFAATPPTPPTAPSGTSTRPPSAKSTKSAPSTLSNPAPPSHTAAPASSPSPELSAGAPSRAVPAEGRTPTSRPALTGGPPFRHPRVRGGPRWPVDPPVDPPAKPAMLLATIDPLGSLVRDRPGIVGVRLRNAGGEPSDQVVASVKLPPGVTLVRGTTHASTHAPARAATHAAPAAASDSVSSALMRRSGGREKLSAASSRIGAGEPGGGRAGTGAAGAGPEGTGGTGSGRAASGAARSGPIGSADGWACRTGKTSVRCVRSGLAPGRTSAIFLRVKVAEDAPEGAGPAVSVRAGALKADARSKAGVRASGATARFAADGRLVTRTVGNTLLSCPPTARGCAAARKGAPGRRDNNQWPMTPVDRDADPATQSSSSARFDLPKGSHVLWAGLYWSATGPGDAPAGDIQVRAPRAKGYVTVHAAEVVRRKLPVGSGYLAFADVTHLARAAEHGGGRWWVADASMLAGVSRHAGWSLVVVAADARQPYRHMAVLDTAVVIRGGNKPFEVPLYGLSWAGTRARLDLAVWDGDADLGRDSVSLRDSLLRPNGGKGDSGKDDVGNVFDGSVGGRRNGFGVDIDTFHPVLGRRPVLAISTTRDVLLFGMATVSVPTT